MEVARCLLLVRPWVLETFLPLLGVHHVLDQAPSRSCCRDHGSHRLRCHAV